jgi:hypothetical protein
MQMMMIINHSWAAKLASWAAKQLASTPLALRCWLDFLLRGWAAKIFKGAIVFEIVVI